MKFTTFILLGLILCFIYSCNLSSSKEKGQLNIKVEKCISDLMHQGDSVISIDSDKVYKKLHYKILHKTPLGNKKSITEYVNCEKNGIEDVYYLNGQLKTERYLIGDYIWFTLKYYSIKGDSLYPGNVSWGKGRLYEYYEDGTLESIVKVKNGWPDSCWTRYYKNGKVASTTNYYNEIIGQNIVSAIDGPFKTYRETGELYQEYTIEKNIITYIKEYDLKGNLVKNEPVHIAFNY